MRSSLFLITLAAFACSAGSDTSLFAPESEPDPSKGGTTAGGKDPPAKTGGSAGESDVGTPPGDATGEGGARGELGRAQQLVPGAVSLVGVTNDGWALFRDGETLSAAEIAQDGEVELVSKHPGSVLIEGPVAFNWADMDWTANVGELSIWSRERGTEEVGETLYAEALVAASADGAAIVYTSNTRKTTTDLVVASGDSSEVLIESLGLASETTCSPSVGFVGSRLFVGWCKEDDRDGRIDLFERDGDGWERSTIAEDALPGWSADAAGERVFFQSNAYEGYYAEDGELYRIDAGVSRGFVLPDGSAVLYTVGDQLRRAALPDPVPVPVVTVGYAEPVGFTRDFQYALYSSKVTYENGTQRDLRLVPTDGYTAEPVELVGDPTATLPRSNMTADGRFVLYLTDVTPEGGNLHVLDLAGNEVQVLPNVLEAAAARGSTVIYTDNASDPEIYPMVADLKLIDLPSGEPELIEERIVDGRNFQLDAERKRVIYVRSGIDRDPEDPASEGLFWRNLP